MATSTTIKSLLSLFFLAAFCTSLAKSQANETITTVVSANDAATGGTATPLEYVYIEVLVQDALSQYTQNPVLSINFLWNCGPQDLQLFIKRGGFPTNNDFDEDAEEVKVTAKQINYFYDVLLSDKQNPVILGVYNPNTATTGQCTYALYIDLDADNTLDTNEVAPGIVQGQRWQFFRTTNTIPRGKYNSLFLVQVYHPASCQPRIVAHPGNFPTEVDVDEPYTQYNGAAGISSLIVNPIGLAYYPESQWFIGVFLLETDHNKGPCSFSIAANVQPLLNITYEESQSHFVAPQAWNFYSISNEKDEKDDLTVELESLSGVPVGVYSQAGQFPTGASFTASMDCVAAKCLLSYTEEAIVHYIGVYNDNPITTANYTLTVSKGYSDPETSHHLSAGAKFGIAIGAILGVTLIVVAVLFARKKVGHRTYEAHPSGPDYNPMTQL